MTNIIMCGGNGTRLWPISRTLMPKQFLKLFNSKSLFELTLQRNMSICNKSMIISNVEQYFLALEQAEENNELSIDNMRFLLEPLGKNTAPAIALACMYMESEEIVLVTPSDHLIKNQEEYERILLKAKELAEKNFLVTFGIQPSSPEVGFGYIEVNKNYEIGKVELNELDVIKFHEKPNLKTAYSYLEDGNHLWNSGIFCFKAGVFLEELKKYSPAIYEASVKAVDNATDTGKIIKIRYEDMDSIPENSIDYAVMEKSDIVKVIPSDINWSDVGSFDSLIKEISNQSTSFNIDIESKNNFYYSDDKNKIIAAIGLENYIIVDTKDVLLISKKGETQKVKDIVDILKSQSKFSMLDSSFTTYRPWGTYTILEDTQGYKIKKIEVKPGKRLSLQKHLHRNEHWVVVSGTATVTVENKEFLVRPNESTYIKMGEVHRLANNGKIPVILIEAQVGEYTSEDDIIRIDDDYDRHHKL